MKFYSYEKGGQKKWGGQVKFYSYKRGVRKGFSHAEGGHKKF